MNGQQEEALQIATIECRVDSITHGFLECPYAESGAMFRKACVACLQASLDAW